MLIAWSGHRPDVFRDPRAAEIAVVNLAGQRAAEGVAFICGGQRGVDQWAARSARKHGLPFHLVLPSGPARFARDWSLAQSASLHELMVLATSVEVIDERGELGSLAYDLRNEAIVRRADVLIVVWTGIRLGGTFHTLCAAHARGVPVEEVLLPRGREPDARR